MVPGSDPGDLVPEDPKPSEDFVVVHVRNFASQGFGVVLHNCFGNVAEICGDYNFPLSNDQRILPGTTNPHKNCAEQIQSWLVKFPRCMPASTS